MAKKSQPEPVTNLPAASSSDDETDASSSSSDDEQQPQQPKKPQIQQPQSEEESDDSDDETEGDDEPQTKPDLKKPILPEPQEDDDSDDESDDDSDESGNSPSASAFTVKPVVSKPASVPVSKSPDPKTPSSKPARVKSRAKRPLDVDEKEIEKPNQEPVKGKGNGKRAAEIETEKIEKIEKGSKSKKSKGGNVEVQSVGKVEKGSKSRDDEGGEKRNIIKWSEEDEVALLSGIRDYKAETGEDVNSKVDGFFEFAKGVLPSNVSKTQLYEKIRRLKKKFQTNVEKGNGEEIVFSRPHEGKLFEISRKIWGSEGTGNEGNDSKVKSSKKKEKKDGNVFSNTNTPVKPDTNKELFVQEEVKDTIMEDKKEETEDIWSLYPRLCASLEKESSGYMTLKVGDMKDYVKGIVSGMGEAMAKELEDDWRDIYVSEHQLYTRKIHVIHKQAEAVSGYIK